MKSNIAKGGLEVDERHAIISRTIGALINGCITELLQVHIYKPTKEHNNLQSLSKYVRKVPPLLLCRHDSDNMGRPIYAVTANLRRWLCLPKFLLQVIVASEVGTPVFSHTLTVRSSMH